MDKNSISMEITKISPSGFKIKGKKITVVSDPLGKSVVLSGAERPDFVVPGPGEYEIGGVDIFGEKEVYRVVIDEISICLFGDYGKKLSEAELDKIGTIDILLVAAVVDSGTIAKLESRVVIPCGNEQEITKFVKEMGSEGVVAQPKYVVSKDKLPETTMVVTLS